MFRFPWVSRRALRIVIALNQLRWLKLRLKTESEIGALNKQLATMDVLLEVANDTKNEPLRKLVNVNQYCLVIQRDLTVLLTNMRVSDDLWLKNLYARNLALLLHEYLRKIGGLLSLDVREEFEAVVVDDGPRKEFEGLLSGLKTLKRARLRHLKPVRNAVIAHRHLDASVQLEMIANVDSELIARIANEVTTMQLRIIRWWSVAVAAQVQADVECTLAGCG